MKIALLALVLAGLASPAFAKDDHVGHGQVPPDETLAAGAYRAANETMHEAMDIEFTGNADADFLLSMIPHHQGAVDMAKAVIRYGSDPEVKKLAEDIIAAQETEIALMEDLLAKLAQ